MRYRLPATICAVALLTAASPRAAFAQASCAMPQHDVAWTARALAAADLAAGDILRLPGAELPAIVMFDARCAYRREAGTWRGEPHGGAVPLPDGRTLPPQVASFAAPYDEDRRVFFAMALPGIWRSAGVESGLGLETLMSAVLVHEMTHTRQFRDFSPRLAALTTRYGLPDDLDDDVVQTRFAGTPDFAERVQVEGDLLFAAAAARDDAAARALVRDARARIEARRARYFVGEDAKHAALEDVFLTLEGVAQWTAWRWLTHPRGGGRPDDAETLAQFRRGGRQWSQDQGLALLLAIDRLVRDWRERAFGEPAATALELLAQAAD
jgi:hypothetical protein